MESTTVEFTTKGDLRGQTGRVLPRGYTILYFKERN